MYMLEQVQGQRTAAIEQAEIAFLQVVDVAPNQLRQQHIDGRPVRPRDQVLVFQHRGSEAIALLDAWLAWARRSQIPAFVDLYHRINKHRVGIIAAVTHGLSNGLTESVNTKLRLLTRIA